MSRPAYTIGRFLAAAMLVVTLALTFGVTASFAQDRGGPGANAAAADVPPALRDWIEGMPPELRESALARLRNLPPHRRRAFFRRYERMSEPQRRMFETRLERKEERRLRDFRGDIARGDRRGVREHYRRMAPAERRQFRARVGRWQDMKADDREAMRARLERFRGLSEAEQEALVERSFPDASERERAHKLEQLRRAARAQPPRGSNR
jgi:hypothetical protein